MPFSIHRIETAEVNFVFNGLWSIRIQRQHARKTSEQKQEIDHQGLILGNYAIVIRSVCCLLETSLTTKATLGTAILLSSRDMYAIFMLTPNVKPE